VDGDGDLLSADREFPCPSAWISVSAYREYELSALRTTERRSIYLAPSGLVRAMRRPAPDVLALWLDPWE